MKEQIAKLLNNWLIINWARVDRQDCLSAVDDLASQISALFNTEEIREKIAYYIYETKYAYQPTVTRINDFLKLEEIKCVLRNDGHYPESYQNGDYPEDAWQSEIEAIGDSQ